MERTSLISYLERMTNVDRKTIEAFVDIFVLQSLQKNEELKSEIEGQSSICFVIDGLLYERQNGESIDSQRTTPLKFHQPRQIFTIAPQNMSNTTIIALRQSLALIADYSKIKAILKREPSALDLINDIYQHCLLQNHSRIANLAASPAKVRYEMASQQLGTSLYHIPKYLLANYLNISCKQLQRIIYQQLLIEKHTPVKKHKNNGTSAIASSVSH